MVTGTLKYLILKKLPARSVRVTAYSVGCVLLVVMLSIRSPSQVVMQGQVEAQGKVSRIWSGIWAEYRVEVKNVGDGSASNVEVHIEAPENQRLQFERWQWQIGKPSDGEGEISCRPSDNFSEAICHMGLLGSGQSVILWFRTKRESRVHDPSNNRIMVFGGQSNKPYTTDVWVIANAKDFDEASISANDDSVIGDVNPNRFFVYENSDSGFNKGFPLSLAGSGFVPNPVVNDGCGNLFYHTLATQFAVSDAMFSPILTDAIPNRMYLLADTTLSSISGMQFAGLNFQEPENLGQDGIIGRGYDLATMTAVQFDARSSSAPLKVEFRDNGGGRLSVTSNIEAELHARLYYVQEKRDWILNAELYIRPGSSPESYLSEGLSTLGEALRKNGWVAIEIGRNVFSWRRTATYAQPSRRLMSPDTEIIELVPVPLHLNSTSSLALDAPPGVIAKTFPPAQPEQATLKNGLIRRSIRLQFAFNEEPYIAMEVNSELAQLEAIPLIAFIKTKVGLLISMIVGAMLAGFSKKLTALLSRKSKQPKVGFAAGIG